MAKACDLEIRGSYNELVKSIYSLSSSGGSAIIICDYIRTADILPILLSCGKFTVLDIDLVDVLDYDFEYYTIIDRHKNVSIYRGMEDCNVSKRYYPYSADNVFIDAEANSKILSKNINKKSFNVMLDFID